MTAAQLDTTDALSRRTPREAWAGRPSDPGIAHDPSGTAFGTAFQMFVPRLWHRRAILEFTVAHRQNVDYLVVEAPHGCLCIMFETPQGCWREHDLPGKRLLVF